MKKNFRIIKSSENNLIMFLKEGKVGLIGSPQKSVDAYLDYLETQK